MSNNTRALNDYTANLPEKQRTKNKKKFKEPLKSVNNPSTNSPIEPRNKKSNYVIAP